MSNGKEYEVKGTIDIFGVSFDPNDLDELFENAKRKVGTLRADYDYISNLPFVFGETENGIVAYSAGRKLAIARPDSTVDGYEVVEITENEFNEVF